MLVSSLTYISKGCVCVCVYFNLLIEAEILDMEGLTVFVNAFTCQLYDEIIIWAHSDET